MKVIIYLKTYIAWFLLLRIGLPNLLRKSPYSAQ